MAAPPLRGRSGEFPAQGAADIFEIGQRGPAIPAARFGPSDGLCHHAEDHAQFGFACPSTLSHLARFITRRSPVGRFGEVASDLVARRDATKPLSLAFEG